jgi:hypothetical protein
MRLATFCMLSVTKTVMSWHHLREYSLEDDLTFHDSAVYGLLRTDR